MGCTRTQLEGDLKKAVGRKEGLAIEREGVVPLYDEEEARRKELLAFGDLSSPLHREFAPSLEAYKRQQTGKGKRKGLGSRV